MTFRTPFARLCLGLCLAFSLAACDSATTDDDTGDDPGTTLGDGSVSITGDVEASLEGGAVYYFYQDGGFGVTIADVDFTTIESDDDLPPEYLNVEVHTGTPEVGTLSVGDTTGLSIDYINDNGINGSDDNDANAVSGTLTLTEVTDERIVGTISAALLHESDEPNAQLEASFEAVLLEE